MCGICGFYSFQKKLSSVILKMNAAIKHRGSDDEGYFLDKKSFAGEDSMPEIKNQFPELSNTYEATLAMGFRRLSILDLSDNGHQPMVSELGNVITFNGEIYNFKKIRTELEQQGIVFRSNTDSEVILRGYEFFGLEIIRKLDGMFSFCIWDKNLKKLIFARDRIGLKPFFYFKNENGLFWASEIKALLASEQIQPEINWEGVRSNFMYLTTVSPQTCFQNIFSLQPGNYGVFDLENNGFAIQKYYEIPNRPSQKTTAVEATEKIEKLLTESVAMQLQADVQVTSMMSGGIDSTLITAIAKKEENSLSAFTINYVNAEEEVKNAKEVAEKYHISHQTEKIESSEILADLKENIAHFEEPYATPEVLISAAEFARKLGYKVILSGNGADELFGGYGHLLNFDRWKKRRKLKFLRILVGGNSDFSKKVRNYFSLESAEDFFRNGQGGMKPYEIESLFLEPVSAVSKEKSGDSYHDYFLEEMKVSLSSHHVFRDDLSAMKFGVEFRYPYLSNDLVNYVASLPEDLRFTGKINKPLLRRLAEDYLPENVLKMRKKGFSYPLRNWYEDDQDLRNFVDEHIQQLLKRTIFRNETIQNWYQNISKNENLSKIWQLVTFEVWLQTYLD